MCVCVCVCVCVLVLATWIRTLVTIVSSDQQEEASHHSGVEIYWFLLTSKSDRVDLKQCWQAQISPVDAQRLISLNAGSSAKTHICNQETNAFLIPVKIATKVKQVHCKGQSSTP